MKQIPLTKGRIAIVDDEDYEYLVSVGRWCYASSGYAAHYFTNAEGQRRTLWMHRLVMARRIGQPTPRGITVDHINRDRLDNRRENLRLATYSEQQSNKGLNKNNSTGLKGVTHVSPDQFEARIKINRRRIYLGRHATAEAAAEIFAAASILLNQDFAGGLAVAEADISLKAWEHLHRIFTRNKNARALLQARRGDAGMKELAEQIQRLRREQGTAEFMAKVEALMMASRPNRRPW